MTTHGRLVQSIVYRVFFPGKTIFWLRCSFKYYSQIFAHTETPQGKTGQSLSKSEQSPKFEERGQQNCTKSTEIRLISRINSKNTVHINTYTAIQKIFVLCEYVLTQVGNFAI